MERRSWVVLLMLLLAGQGMAQAQEGTPEDVREARVWLDRGDEPVVARGDRVRVYYRTSHDSYVAVFHIDTDGSVRLVHPAAPDEDHYVRGGRDYRLLFPRSPYWNVDEDPGVGYYFLVASAEPFDFSNFDYARYDRGWDLTRAGRSVYEDPYLAMDDYVAALIPEWEYVPYALDFISYNVGGTHEYPRFMCYQCHAFQSYTDWNPYLYSCTDFRVVIWDDPYYYPAYRYSGTHVVYTTPLRARPRFEFTARVGGQPWTPLVRYREPPPARTVQYKEPQEAPSRVSPPTQRRATPSAVAPPSATPGRAAVGATPAYLSRSGQARPSGKASTGRSSRPIVSPPRASTQGTSSQGTSSRGRPTLQRRPTTPTRSGGLVTPSTRRPASSPTTTRSRPSGTRSIAPSRGSTRPSTSSGRAPTTSRPAVTRPAPSSGRPTVRPPSRAPATRARPTVKPRSGGATSSARPPVRRRGGGDY